MGLGPRLKKSMRVQKQRERRFVNSNLVRGGRIVKWGRTVRNDSRPLRRLCLSQSGHTRYFFSGAGLLVTQRRRALLKEETHEQTWFGALVPVGLTWVVKAIESTGLHLDR